MSEYCRYRRNKKANFKAVPVLS